MSAGFLRAVEAWRNAQPDDDPEAYENAEAVILRRKPHSDAEAAIILEVVAVNVSAGPRCDELDIRALKAINQWLLNKQNPSALRPRLELAV